MALVGRWWWVAYSALVIAAYALVALHMPMALLPGAGHDDGLFMRLGQSIAEGEWLGPYSQFTLMKGPGYPVFLAINHWIGFPLSLSHALFNGIAAVLFALIVREFVKSNLVSAVLITLIVWMPSLLVMSRVIRGQIYSAQALLVVAAFAGALYVKERSTLYAVLAGTIAAWFSLTREEGIWLVPALLVILIARLVLDANRAALFSAARVLLIFAFVFLSVHAGFRALNYFSYGSFVGVDFKEKNFNRSLRALQSVKDGETKPYVPISFSSMARVAAVSPTFASIHPYFLGPGKGWGVPACGLYESACGEIGGGWFVWALRDAAASVGHYSTPQEAAHFFGRLATELEGACADGKLTCEFQPISAMPHWTWPQLNAALASELPQALRMLTFVDTPTAPQASAGRASPLTRAITFLNFPNVYPSPEVPMSSSDLTIRYRVKASQAIVVEVRAADGSRVELLDGTKEHHVSHVVLRGPQARGKRVQFSVDCRNNCSVHLRTSSGEQQSFSLSELEANSVRFIFDDGRIKFDRIPEYKLYMRNDGYMYYISTGFAKFISSIYKFIYIPVLILGLLLFIFLTFSRPIRSLSNPCYVLVSGLWASALALFSILILVTASSFPAITSSHLAPVSMFAICASVLSIAAFAQICTRRYDTRAVAAADYRQP